jgi:hypothetical protein
VQGAVSITTLSLPAGTTGVGYSQSIGVSPAGNYTFSLIQGSLPSGLTLNSVTGVIAGTVVSPGVTNFIIKAQSPNGCSATQAFSLTISCPTVMLAPATLPNGQIGTPYSQMISASPAGGNYSYSASVGLPPGLGLNPMTGS